MTIACSALTTKLSTTCCSSVSTASTCCFELSSTRSSMSSDSSRRCRSSATDVMTSMSRTGAGLARLLPREQREVADDAAGAGALLLNQTAGRS